MFSVITRHFIHFLCFNVAFFLFLLAVCVANNLHLIELTSVSSQQLLSAIVFIYRVWVCTFIAFLAVLLRIEHWKSHTGYKSSALDSSLFSNV